MAEFNWCWSLILALIGFLSEAKNKMSSANSARFVLGIMDMSLV